MKADDDTYVIVENLRLLLSNYTAKDPVYFGCQFKPFTPQGSLTIEIRQPWNPDEDRGKKLCSTIFPSTNK